MGRFSELRDTIKRKAPTTPQQEDLALKPKEEKDTSVAHDLLHLKGKDALTMAKALKDMAAGEPLNDRELLLEKGVEMLQTLPSNSGLSHALSDGFIGMLWRDLPHPPLSTIEPRSHYRTADGSRNNLHNPDLGKAGSPYSRTVPAVTPKSPFLPDPELIFDQLLKREGFREHKAGLNRLFFSFATVVIHECFQTDHARPWINNTSSYVDLSTLYGNNQAQQDTVRTKEMGRIYPDTIASDRIMMMPPGVIAVLLLFSRHHNYLAERLFDINESGKYKPWDQLDEAGKAWQDEDIFQLSRNINVAYFAKCVLTDYVSAILNTVREDSDWHLELGKEIKDASGARLERGTGNNVSCEFAVLYHWHSYLSAADEKWMEEMLLAEYPDKSVDDIGPMEFHHMAKKHKAKLDATPPSAWTFGGLERSSTGYFQNDQLAKLIKDAIEEPAHAFGARSTPSCMKVIEIMGMLQARNVFKVCTMNEFRKYLNLAPFKSFDEWNPQPDVARAAETLYGDIDSLELYPGLMAEQAKPNMPGSGVQPGHTIGRGILDDAVALVRGDRFLTVDLTATTLTSWGLAALTPCPGGYGGFLGHLLYRALPRSWGRYSTYNLLPFYTPSAIAGIIKKNGKTDLYDTSRPPDVDKLHGVHSYDACKEIFHNRDLYRNIYHYNLDVLTDHAGFMIGFDDHARHDERVKYMHRAFFEPNFESNVRNWFRKGAQEHIEKYSLGFSKGGRKQLNVARDVFNRVPVIWLADKYAIPLKTEHTPHGVFTVHELFGTLLALFIYSSFDQIPHASWILRQAALELGPIIRKIIKTRLEINSGAKEKVHDYFAKGTAYEVSEAADHLYHSVIQDKIPIDKAVGDIMGCGIPVAGNLTQQSTLILDLFLSPGYEYAKERFTELAQRDDAEAEKEMEMWVYEGMRLSGVVPGLPRVAAEDVVIRDGERGEIHVKAGDRVMIATSKAHLDPKAFPNPERLDPTRDPRSYILLGAGMHVCFGARLVAPAIASMLRQVFRLKNLRRAAGPRGKLIRLHEDLGHNGDACRIYMYLDQFCKEGPIPSSLVVEYDE